ncbi:MAG: hypothetical protein GY866_34920 [Proteobacteria bacterium]|nr:hypothetical protein [Pseudomonadota bacterium]
MSGLNPPIVDSLESPHSDSTKNPASIRLVKSISIAQDRNGEGNRTISTADPSGGENGDVWYQVES